MSQWRMLLVFQAKKRKERKYSPSAGVKSGEAVEWQPSLCHVLSRSAWHFIAISPPSLPLRKGKVYNKQLFMENKKTGVILPSQLHLPLPLYLSLRLDSHLPFPFQMPMLLFKPSCKDAEV